MKVENHHNIPKLDHRSAPSRPGKAGLGGDSPPVPRARAQGRRHDQLGNFQTALLGRITLASTNTSVYPLIGDLPPKREKPAMTPDERLKLQKELIAARDRQAPAGKARAPAAPAQPLKP